MTQLLNGRHNTCPPTVSLPRQTGASLIEVLVAILLVALGILSMAAMQVNANRVAKGSEFRAMGALLASDLADRMRANRAGVLFRATPDATASNQYAFTTKYPANGNATVTGTAPACDTAVVECTATEMAQFDMLAWRKAVAASLPGGWARVAEVDTTINNADPAENAVDLWLMWVDPQSAQSLGDEQTCPSGAVETPPTGSTAPSPRCMYFRINL